MGDIVLTTPIIRCLKLQLNAEIHFLVKPQFKELVSENPHITATHEYNDAVLSSLKKENYDLIVDLQKNRKSTLLRKKLQVKSYTFRKLNFKKWLYVQSGINLLPQKHIIDRYFEGISDLGVKSDGLGCEFYAKAHDVQSTYNLPKRYIVIAAGAAHEGKTLRPKQLEELCNESKEITVLLGNQKDLEATKNISLGEGTINLCGKTSIGELGELIKKSSGVISGDTGIMHIASCFNVPQVSVWGCTRASLGMWPYLKSNHLAISPDSNRPCSKLGNACKTYPDLCISVHSSRTILEALDLLIKEESL